jgi:superfamily I DNA and RNA helicase
MIPAMIPEETRSEAEKKLFPILRDKLDGTFTVFHSFDLLTHNREDKFLEGEIDFLIFSPEHGILVLEVKSGSIAFDGESRTWYQNELPLKQSPFEQSLNTKYQLRDFLTKKLGFAPAVTMGHAVCFPDIVLEDTRLPSGSDPEICIDSHKLSNLQNNILKIMEHFHKSNWMTVDIKQSERVRQVLMPYFESAVTLANRIKQEEAQIVSLTENQCRMLDFIQNRKQALIQGCAGSGKTIMAVKKAKELAAVGHSVLLLAYNTLLGERLADSVKDIPKYNCRDLS